MAQFRDILPSQQTWLHDLAKAEIHPDAERLLQLGATIRPSTAGGREHGRFSHATPRSAWGPCARVQRVFRSGQKFQEVKIYSNAQTAADFMLFRNQVKLVVSNPAHGVIQIAFAQHNRGAISVDGVSGAAPTQTRHRI